MTIGVTTTIPAYAHGGTFPANPPPFIVIHSTEGPMSAGNARALAQWFAKPPANGGPGTSATKIWDPSEGVRMLSDSVVPYHCGSAGNPRGTGDEHCGSVNLTVEQWMTADGQAMLDGSAKSNAEEAHQRGWSLADCKWLTLTEVAQFSRGFCTHNDIRLALGGTTHSDPGPNFPYSWYMDRVRAWYQDPINAGEDASMAAWSDTDSANLKRLADATDRTFREGFRSLDTAGNYSPSAENYTVRGINAALDLHTQKFDTLAAQNTDIAEALADLVTLVTGLPAAIAAALQPPAPPAPPAPEA